MNVHTKKIFRLLIIDINFDEPIKDIYNLQKFDIL